MDEEMQKTVEEINPTKRRFTVEVPADVLEERIIQRLRSIGRTAKIPGFRPGKAPLSLLERRFGKDVEAEVVERVISEYYLRAVREEDVIPAAAPVFEHYDFKRKAPFRMTFTLEVYPEVKDLRYEGYTIEDEEIEVTEEDVERALSRIQLEKSSFETVEDGVADDDLVTVDYEIIEEGEKVENQYIKVGSEIIPAEISDALRGKRVGEAFEATATFPQEYPNRKMGGRTLTFKGTIKEVKRLKKAELNDDLARDLGYEDTEGLREAVRETIARAKRELLEERQKGELVRELVRRHDLEVPEGLLKPELRALLEDEKRKNPDVDVEKAMEELRGRAVDNVKANMLLDMIAVKEKVEVSEEELMRKISELARGMYLDPESFMNLYMQREGSIDALRQSMMREKAVEVMFRKAVRRGNSSGTEGQRKGE